MRGRLILGTLLATVLALLAFALPASAAKRKQAPKGKATVTRCHTAKRSGKSVRVCTTLRCHLAKRKGKSVRVCTPVHKAKAKKEPVKPKPMPAATPRSLAPVDYTKLSGLSQLTYTNVQRTVHELTVADGTRLHLEIVKPEGATNLGVILEASPYHGTLYDRTGGRMIPLPGKDGKPLGLSGFFPQRGYAVVFMDLRGTGLSSGCLNTLGPKDESDLRDTIEWAASQPWSNGRVGMIGHSYVGSTPLAATVLKPKGLVTIVPSAGLSSVYDHQWQDGVPYNAQYLGPIEAYQQLSLQRELPFKINLPDDMGMTGEHFGKDVPQIGCGLKDSSLSSGEQLSGVNTAWHQARDASAAAAAFPGSVFVIHGENDQAARISNLHWLYARGAKAQDKVWIGQWDHGIGCCPNRRGAQWVGAIHAWFDHELLQRNVDTGPPVEVFMNDEPTVDAAIPARKEIYTAPSWPPSVARTLTLDASSDGTLREGGALAGSKSFAGDPSGFLGLPTGNVTFTSAPFTEDTILLGLPKLTLASSVTLAPIDLIATLYSAHGDDLRRISQCAMNPQLRGGSDHITPVHPGVRMQLDPPCFTVSQHVHPGDRLVLQVTTSDPDKLPLFTIDPHITVFTGGAGGTHIDLPVATGTLYPDTAPVANDAIANP
ncbi:MAG TPA: CocE/NonD family hydrolase [Solirubrobacteraceae bacterium]|nr:CocE/NonD family hydrolase [Solirubrobacteraceae bacterium]